MLGEEEERGYRIAFVVDRRPMFKIFTKKKAAGVEKAYSHEVKACVLPSRPIQNLRPPPPLSPLPPLRFD